MSQVRRKIAPPLVGSDIILVIRPGQNVNQVLDCTYDQLVQALQQYFTSADGFVPETRTLTINGVTYDLSQDRSWTVGGTGAVDSVNGQTGVVVLALDDLSDVNAGSPAPNQILQWNGTAWVPATISTGTYSVDNGLTPDPFDTNKFQLGGDLLKSTVITAGNISANNRLEINAPANTSSTGSFTVLGLNPGGTYTSSNNTLVNFQSNDIITALFRTGSAYGGAGTGLYIQSTNALCTPIVIYGSGALGSGEIFKVTDNGQLVLEEYNSSTSFQGVSGTSQGVLNVDNTGKVFVTPAPTGTGTVTNVGTAGLISGGPITTSGTITTSMNTNKLVGRGTAGVGVMEEITLGTGLSLTGTTLSATGGGGLKSGTATQVSPGVYTTTIAGVTSYTAGDTYIIKFDSVNDGDSTLNISGVGAIQMRRNTDVKLNSGAIKANQEITVVYDGTNFQLIGLVYDQVLAYVHNAEGAIISKGQAVYAYKATGNKMSVKLARADDDDTSAKTIGLVYDSSIGIGGEGYIITQGVIEGVNTAAFLAGDTLYLSGTTFGAYTATPTYAPTHRVYVGIVERANANGQIFVRCQNGYELDEIHDVALKAPYQVPINNDVLTYITGTPNLWQARSVSSLLPTSVKTGSFGVTVDGITSVVQVGQVGYVVMPYAGQITGWSITANANGNISFDITKASGAIPTLSIITTGYPTLSGTNFFTSTSLGVWDVNFAAGDVFGFTVRPTPSIIKNATLTIRVTKT